MRKVRHFECTRDLVDFNDEFSFPLGEEVLEKGGRLIWSQGYLTYDQLIEISDWKAGRRNRRHIKKNAPENVIKVTRHALSFEDDELKVRVLHSPNLHGVRVPVASTILTFYNPKKYGVIDQHTSRSLYRNKEFFRSNLGFNSRFFRKKKLVGFTVDDYMDYLSIIRRIAEKVSEESGIEFTPRDVDKALWQEDKENGGLLSSSNS